MENKLTPEHICKRLPYGVKIKVLDYDMDNQPIFLVEEIKLINIHDNLIETWNYDLHFTNPHVVWHPILRPLYQLTEEIEHNGEIIKPFEIIRFLDNRVYSTLKMGEIVKVLNLPHWVYDKLLEWHFDTDSLIEQDLAIPVTKEFNPYR